MGESSELVSDRSSRVVFLARVQRGHPDSLLGSAVQTTAPQTIRTSVLIASASPCWTEDDRQLISFPRAEDPTASIVIVAWREAPFLLPCLESVAAKVANTPYEVLLVLNEPSMALSSRVEREVAGAVVMKLRANLGFGGAVNYAAQKARGEYLVLLNDDCVIEPGWLEALVEAAGRRPNAGLIGGTFLHPDGTLQEAGSILWSDGSSSAVGDGRDATFMRFERRVDYCSGGSLLIRKDVWEALGGFDDQYYPAYYEDVDLSLRAAEQGVEVWYQPLSVLRHVRSASAGLLRQFLDDQNRDKFRSRWAARLREQAPFGLVEQAIWLAMGKPTRILVLDDYLPDPSIGAGYGRMYDTLTAIGRQPDMHVDLHPTDTGGQPSNDLAQMGVRIIDDLDSHLATPGVDYDIVIISRPNNFSFFDKLRSALPEARIIYDAESLFYRRLESKSDLVTDSKEREGLRAGADEIRSLETTIFTSVDGIVCISDEEAAEVRKTTDTNVWVVEPWSTGPSPTSAGFGERQHVGFVAGWASGPGSPNCEGLLWFAHEVLPRVRAALPGVRVLVTGASPPPEVSWMDQQLVDFVGHVHDLSEFYNRIRVVISPTRFGAGVKLKTVEAIQYGVPVVATREAAAGLNPELARTLWETDDARRFADAIVDLMTDREAWGRARRAELDLRAGDAEAPVDLEAWPKLIREVVGGPVPQGIAP